MTPLPTCPLCERQPDVQMRHDVSTGDAAACLNDKCVMFCAWMPLVAWSALPRRNPKAEEAVEHFANVLGDTKDCEHNKSRPGMCTEHGIRLLECRAASVRRIRKARAAVLSMAVVPTTKERPKPSDVSVCGHTAEQHRGLGECGHCPRAHCMHFDASVVPPVHPPAGTTKEET